MVLHGVVPLEMRGDKTLYMRGFDTGMQSDIVTSKIRCSVMSKIRGNRCGEITRIEDKVFREDGLTAEIRGRMSEKVLGSSTVKRYSGMTENEGWCNFGCGRCMIEIFWNGPD